MANWFEWQGDTLILALRIQPKASRDEFAGIQGERLKLRITAPPVDGKANAHLLSYIAKTFGVAKNKVRILSGESGREKRVSVTAPENWQQFMASITQIEAA